MKNTVKIIGIIAFIAIIGLTIAACGGGGGKLDGTYENTTAGFTTSFTFEGNTVVMKMGGSVLAEGTFETKNGELSVAYTNGVSDSFKYTIKGNTLTLNNSSYGEAVYTKK
ncbi:MAG: hypothetical protein FWD28_05285 [Treponema sp.]|nr:hypothetical protein [Treponema sp.]